MAILALLSLYGLYLLARGFIRLYKEGETKLLAFALGFFILVPLLVWLIARLSPEQRNVWLVLPVLLLALAWAGLGYGVEAYLRLGLKRRLAGKKREIPARPAHWLRDNALRLAGGGALWLAGLLIPFDQPVLETMALCVCLYLLVRGIWGFWRYRGF